MTPAKEPVVKSTRISQGLLGNRTEGKKTKIVCLLLIVLFTGALLSLFRDAVKDEALYLQETAVMAESLRNGAWFGNETVGTHGFLFKMPAALIFLITGESVFAATLMNIIFALLALLLCYLILFEVMSSDKWALGGTFLVFTSFYFVKSLATFLRTIPALLAVSVFIYLIVKKKNRWLIALALLLVLDAKESVFFMILPGILAGICIAEYHKSKPRIGIQYFTRTLSQLGIIIFPSILFIVLMLATGIVPLNEKTSFALGLNKKGFKGMTQRVLIPKRGAQNTFEGGKDIFQISSFDLYGWRASPGAKATLSSEVAPRKESPVVKLTKPREESEHRIKGHFHWTRSIVKTQYYLTGEIIRYSIFYKTQDKNIQNLAAVVWQPENWKNAARKIITLVPDGQWHHVQSEIRVNNEGRFDAGFVWPRGRDMTLYVAGCKIEKIDPQGEERFPASSGETGPHEHTTGSKISGFFLLIKNKIIPIINIILMYFGKLLYPRTFSFLSIPKLIVLPAVFMSFVLYKKWRVNRETEKLIIFFIFWSYLLLYIIRWSIGRYLLPISPLIMLLFLFFLRDGLKNIYISRAILVATCLFIAIGMLFESNYILYKIILNVILLSVFWSISFLEPQKNTHQRTFKFAFVALIGFLTFCVALSSSLLQPGQIGRYAAWGYNSEWKKISSLTEREERIWINTNPHLIRFYRKNTSIPSQNKTELFELKDWIPKKRLMRSNIARNTFSFKWKTAEEFESELKRNRVSKVLLVFSTHADSRFQFPGQEKRDEMIEMPFLSLEQKLPLKNKELYIFKYQFPKNSL